MGQVRAGRNKSETICEQVKERKNKADVMDGTIENRKA
jgi:hypothetical protein